MESWLEYRRGILWHRLCGQPRWPLKPVLLLNGYVTLGKSLNLDFFIGKTATVEWKRNNEYVKHLPQMPNMH